MSDDAGCICFIGVVCAAPAVGCLYGAAYGWITLGGGFVAIGIISSGFTLIRQFIRRRNE